MYLQTEARYCIYRQRLEIVSTDNPLTCVNTNTPTTGAPAFVTRYAIVEIPGINEDTIFIVASFFGYIEFLHNFARKEFLLHIFPAVSPVNTPPGQAPTQVYYQHQK